MRTRPISNAINWVLLAREQRAAAAATRPSSRPAGKAPTQAAATSPRPVAEFIPTTSNVVYPSELQALTTSTGHRIGEQGSSERDAQLAQSAPRQSADAATAAREESAAAPDRTLTADDERLISELRATDRKVRAHEAAHKAAAGGVARGGASFNYVTGPDGGRYAVGGEVAIDASPVPGNPTATIHKMQQVRRAALAPADPSGQDRQVAALASRHEAEARREVMRENVAELRPDDRQVDRIALEPSTGSEDQTDRGTDERREPDHSWPTARFAAHARGQEQETLGTRLDRRV